MPGGAGAVGYLAFGLVKAAGYTVVARSLKRMSGAEGPAAPKVLSVGLARTGVGIAVGLAYGWLWLTFGPESDLSPLIYYALLFPIRLAEWGVVLWFFFGRNTTPPEGFYWKGTLLGTAASYGLDAIGVVAAFVVPGGFWIC